jgi:hypothetical protein
MTDPITEGPCPYTYTPCGAAAEAVANALTPYIRGRGILARSERRRVAAAVITASVAATPADGSPGERVGAYLKVRVGAEARAVMLSALAYAMAEQPGDPIAALPALAALLAPAPCPPPLRSRP